MRRMIQHLTATRVSANLSQLVERILRIFSNAKEVTEVSITLSHPSPFLKEEGVQAVLVHEDTSTGKLKITLLKAEQPKLYGTGIYQILLDEGLFLEDIEDKLFGDDYYLEEEQ